jgi:5-methylcytosine-specific restriction endonuclease McrA
MKDGTTYRETVDATPRASMGPIRRARIIARSGGHCAYPKCTVSTDLEIDHVVPIWMGGKDVDENCEALCDSHHKQKTKVDAAMRAKAKRLIAGPKKSKRPIQGRGFQTTLTRGFDGKVRPRS